MLGRCASVRIGVPCISARLRSIAKEKSGNCQKAEPGLFLKISKPDTITTTPGKEFHILIKC